MIGTGGKAPFYAVEIVPDDVSTYGRVVTDEAGRVLYATGVSTTSTMGGVYPGSGASRPLLSSR